LEKYYTRQAAVNSRMIGWPLPATMLNSRSQPLRHVVQSNITEIIESVFDT